MAHSLASVGKENKYSVTVNVELSRTEYWSEEYTYYGIEAEDEDEAIEEAESMAYDHDFGYNVNVEDVIAEEAVLESDEEESVEDSE